MQDRLLQLSGSQVSNNQVVNNAILTTSCGANSVTLDNPGDKVASSEPRQVDISAVDTKMDYCFRPIYPMKVTLPNGHSANVYGLFDTGSNKTLISKAFQQRFKIQTRRVQVTLNGVGSSTSGLREVAQISLQSLVDSSFVIKDVEVFVVEHLPINSSHIARQAHINQYDYMKDVKLKELPETEVYLIIGTDLAPAFAHIETRCHDNSSAIAIRNSFGWAIMGPTGSPRSRSAWSACLSTLSSKSTATNKRCIAQKLFIF